MTADTRPVPADRITPVRRPGVAAPSGRRRRLTPLWLLLPTAAVLVPLFAYPIWQLGLLSVLDFRQAQVSGGQPTRFVGADNYATLFGDPRFWSVLWATVRDYR